MYLEIKKNNIQLELHLSVISKTKKYFFILIKKLFLALKFMLLEDVVKVSLEVYFGIVLLIFM